MASFVDMHRFAVQSNNSAEFKKLDFKRGKTFSTSHYFAVCPLLKGKAKKNGKLVMGVGEIVGYICSFEAVYRCGTMYSRARSLWGPVDSPVQISKWPYSMFPISYFPSSHIPKLGNFHGPMFLISYKDCVSCSLFHAHIPYSDFVWGIFHVSKLPLREPV